MRIKNVRPSFNRVYLCGFLLVVAAFPVRAQITAGDVQAAIDEAKWRKYVANIRVNSGSAAVSLPAGASGGKVGITKLLAGVPSLETKGLVSIGGASVPISTTVKAAAGATGRLAMALAKTAGPVGVAVAAYELFQAIDGYTVAYRPEDHSLDVKKIQQTVETEFSTGGDVWVGSAEAAGKAYASASYPSGSYWAPTRTTCNTERCWIYSESPNGPGMYLTSIALVSRQTQGGKITDSTEQELANMIDAAMTTGIPSGMVEGTRVPQLNL